jgi:hypothetical protein
MRVIDRRHTEAGFDWSPCFVGNAVALTPVMSGDIGHAAFAKKGVDFQISRV